MEKDYFIMVNKDPIMLSDKVSKLLNEGYELHGSLQVSISSSKSQGDGDTINILLYAQAIVKLS